MNATVYDAAIIGSGPAGSAAAVNLTIRKKSILLFGPAEGSKQLNSSPRIDNYLGFHNISGRELQQKFFDHAQAMGIQLQNQMVKQIIAEDDRFMLSTNTENYYAKVIIIATGIKQGDEIPGEKELLGMGVSYCATCDGPLFSGKKVAFISYGPHGEKEADFLAEICGEVIYVPLYENVGKLNAKVQVISDQPKAIKGQQKVENLVLSSQSIPVDGVFLHRETIDVTVLLPGLELDEYNHIKVNAEMETNIPRVYAAGDCAGRPYQVAKSVGQGTTAALNSIKHLK